VAATPRTGSSLLCEGLAATGIAGVPDEVFTPEHRAMWHRYWSLDNAAGFSEYANAALRHGSTGNGVTSFKIHWMHVAALAKDSKCRSGDVLSELLPKALFVNVVRRDRLSQALSWFRANATNVWSRFDDVPADSLDPAPALDIDTVRDLEAHIDWQQTSWLKYFESREIVPLTIEYEALDEDYRGEIASVLAYLGLDTSAARRIPRPRRIRQADAITMSWRRRWDLTPDRGH
jgi:trehalose 2-sulfotransferase